MNSTIAKLETKTKWIVLVRNIGRCLDRCTTEPSHTKYSLKHKTIADKSSRNKGGNKIHHQAAIQYFDEESEELVGPHIHDLARAYEKKADDDYILPNIPKTLIRDTVRDDKKTDFNYYKPSINVQSQIINKSFRNINLKKENINYDKPQIKQNASSIHMKQAEVYSTPHFNDEEGAHYGHPRQSDVITEKPKHRMKPHSDHNHSQDLLHIIKYDTADNLHSNHTESKSRIGSSSLMEKRGKKLSGRNITKYHHPVQGSFEKRAFDSLETENRVFENLHKSKIKIERLISQKLRKHTTSSFSEGKSHMLSEESNKSEKKKEINKANTYEEDDISLNKKQKETTTDNFQSSHIKNNNKSKKDNVEAQLDISQIFPHVLLKPRSETYINWDEPHSHKKDVSSHKSSKKPSHKSSKKSSHKHKHIEDWEDSTSFKNTDGDKSSGRQGEHKKEHVKDWYEDTDSIKGKGHQGEHKKKHIKDWVEDIDGDKDTGRQGKYKKKHAIDWDDLTSYINNAGDKGTGRQGDNKKKHVKYWDDPAKYINNDVDKGTGRQGDHKKKHVKDWEDPVKYINNDGDKGTGRQGDHKKKHVKDWDNPVSNINNDSDKGTVRQGENKKKHVEDWDDPASYINHDGDKGTGRQGDHVIKHVKDWDGPASYKNNDDDKGTGRQGDHKKKRVKDWDENTDSDMVTGRQENHKKEHVKDWDVPASYINNDGGKGTGRQGDQKKKHFKDWDDPASYIKNDDDKGIGRQKGHKNTRVTMIYNKLEESEREYFHEASNESPQTDSDEQKLGLRFDEKIFTEALYIYDKKVNADKENLRSPVRADGIANSQEFSPHSIARQLHCLSKKLKGDANIEQEIIGRTSEYNDLVLWKIKGDSDNSDTVNFRASDKKKKYADEPPEKKIVFIVHALSVMGFLDLECLSKVEKFKTLLGYYMDNLDKFDIFLIPMANPDGVTKNQKESWWNKNISPQSACPGINVDRNFDVQWNSSYGKQMSSCSQNYPGVHAFSEPESQAVREVFRKYGHKIVGYFHVHAGTYDATTFKGDAVLYPKGYASTTSDDDKYMDLKGEIDEAMRNTSFKVLSVTVDTLYNWYGKVLGTSVDYASSIYGIPYALELVMQIYEDNPSIEDPSLREQNVALTEVWKVLIEVIFDSMYRNTVKATQQ